MMFCGSASNNTGEPPDVLGGMKSEKPRADLSRRSFGILQRQDRTRRSCGLRAKASLSDGNQRARASRETPRKPPDASSRPMARGNPRGLDTEDRDGRIALQAPR